MTSTRTYHHIGIPTTEAKEGEVLVESWKVSFTPYDVSTFHVQWCRYHEGCILPDLIQTQPHVAFIVEDLDAELEGKKIIFGPYIPLEGWRVAFIEECGAPIELIETKLTEEQIKAREIEVFNKPQEVQSLE